MCSRYISLVHAFSFFFNATAPTEIYTLSLHDALPISRQLRHAGRDVEHDPEPEAAPGGDRKSTRLNSSHPSISYAVFCLKKKTRLRHTYTIRYPNHTTICNPRRNNVPGHIPPVIRCAE